MLPSLLWPAQVDAVRGARVPGAQVLVLAKGHLLRDDALRVPLEHAAGRELLARGVTRDEVGLRRVEALDAARVELGLPDLDAVLVLLARQRVRLDVRRRDALEDALESIGVHLTARRREAHTKRGATHTRALVSSTG